MKLNATLLVPCAIALIAGCSSPKPTPVSGIRAIETIEMTEARARAEADAKDQGANIGETAEWSEETLNAPDIPASEDLLPPDPGMPELDGEGDWVEGEMPGLPAPIGAPTPDQLAEQMNALESGAAVGRSPMPEITEPQFGEWRTPEGVAAPPAYTPPAYTPPASTPPASEFSPAGARSSSFGTDVVPFGVGGSVVVDTPAIPARSPLNVSVPSIDSVVAETQAMKSGAGTSQTIMVGSRPVTLNFVNGQWVGPQGETYSQLPIVGELLPRYGN